MVCASLVPTTDAGPFHVLVVEDEFIIRFSLAEELRQLGITVIEAASADEAWTYIQSGGRFDLVFSDVQMPGSLNGIDLVSRLASTHPFIPLVLTSGNVGAAAIVGIAAFVPKPYASSVMATTLREMLERYDDRPK